ncbi:MAG: hypothetical protein ACO1OB_14480 [Archangium sp.]
MSADTFAPVLSALSAETGVTAAPGWGRGNLVLKLRGKMFLLRVGEDLVAKLPAARVAELVERKVGSRFDPRRNGQLMKEWLVVPPGAADWLALGREALAFARR